MIGRPETGTLPYLMSARLLDGKALAERLAGELRRRAAALAERDGRPPGLAVVMVGDDPASHVYVRNKLKRCQETGIASRHHALPADVDQAALLDLVDHLNADPAIDGILVQLPLPPGLDVSAVIERIDPAKDVDGFHPYNIGRLAVRLPVLRPCTPRGIMTLLAHHQVPLRGAEAVVVGASNIVGRPMALELLLAGATVTVCHRFTRDLEAAVRRAEVLVVAVGRPGLVPGAWIRPGAAVVDVGMNRDAGGRLVGTWTSRGPASGPPGSPRCPAAWAP